MSSSQTDPVLSLSEHVTALYPLARVLAAPDDAAALVRTVYEHAAETPPNERPSNERGWLFQLMMMAHEGTLRSTGAEIHPKREASFTNDPFREEVAERLAHRALPVAFAACSIHERLILAIDVLGNPSDEALAVALETSATNARSIRDQARSTLRACLRDVMSDSERMILDVALSEETLREQLQTLLMERLDAPPETLHHEVTDILVSGPGQRSPNDSSNRSRTSVTEHLRSFAAQAFSVRGALVAVVLGMLLVFGIERIPGGSSASPDAPITLVDYAVGSGPHIENRESVDGPSAASAHIQSIWNRRVSAPSIEGSVLRAVGRVRVSNATDVPVLIFVDTERATQIHAFAFSYAVLDATRDRVLLKRDLRTKLAANNAILVDEHDGRAVALWRQRDDIFVVVAPDIDPESLRSRIRL